MRIGGNRISVPYDVHMLLRKIIMTVMGKNCGTCQNYDGIFGNDHCFDCEHSLDAKEYVKRVPE